VSFLVLGDEVLGHVVLSVSGEGGEEHDALSQRGVEATKNFVATYQNKFGEIPNQFAADGYDCVYAIYEALNNAGATTDMSAEELCDLLIAEFTSSDFTFNGLTGDGMTWDASGAVSKSPKGMVIQNGAYVGMD